MANLEEIYTNTSNVVFLIIISGVFLLSLILFARGKATDFVNYAPTLLTTLGIFGTFFGIFLGLMEFDQNDIEASIPPLLAGLKTAFFTSLAGMLSSLLLKTVSTTSWFSPATTEEPIGSASPEMILATMQAQLKETQLLQQSLAGPEESSLISQLKILRGEVNTQMKRSRAQSEKEFNDQKELFTEFSDNLWVKLQDFSDTLSKSATEAVIDALKKVISDFNNNLTEQFGDNFKQLNAAVLKLVEWQDQYKQQLEEMRLQYEHGVKAISETASSISHISEQAQAIPIAMNELRDVIAVNQHQISELNNHLEAFKDIRDRAVEAVPEIREQVDLTVTEIAKAAQQASDHYQKLLSGSDEYIRQHAETTQRLLDKFTTDTANAANEFGDKVSSVVSTVQGQVLGGAYAVRDSLIEGSETIGKQLIGGSENIKDQLTKGSDAIGTQLIESSATISKRLVEGSVTIGSQLSESSETIKNKLTSGAENIQSTIADAAGDFSKNSTQIGEKLKSQTEQIQTQTDAIEQHLNKTVGSLQSSMGDLVKEVVDGSRDLKETLSEANQSLAKDTEKARDAVLNALTDVQQRLENAMNHTANEHLKLAKSTLDSIEQQMREKIGLTTEVIDTQMRAIDQQMQQELNRVMTEMGRALAQVTGRFTEDYSKLVKAMQDTVRRGDR